MKQAERHPGPMYRASKRTVDFLGAAVLLLLLSPALLAISLATLAVEGRPILFRQVRPGLNGKPFRLYKFRSMKPAANEGSSDEIERITRFGAFLRKTSLDELPSLWNVLRGDMSFVGPRPLLVEYLDFYSSEHQVRHSVRPGLTGLAQVSGRNLVSWVRRLDLDVVYIRKQSLRFDAWIVYKTIGLVLTSKGVTTEDGTTMPPMTKDYL